MNMATDTMTLPPDFQKTFGKEPRYEFIDGQLREKPHMGAEANRVVTVLISLLANYVAAHKLGLVFSQTCGYQSFRRDPRKVRKPDASFIARGRLENDHPPRGHINIAPELVVEVVSPSGLAEEIDMRVADYLAAGVKLLWVIYPATRAIVVFRKDGNGARLTEGQELRGEDTIPGFACRVDALFADLSHPHSTSGDEASSVS